VSLGETVLIYSKKNKKLVTQVKKSVIFFACDLGGGNSYLCLRGRLYLLRKE